MFEAGIIWSRKIQVIDNLGQTVPCLLQTIGTCLAPPTNAVLAFSTANAPIPTITTFLPKDSRSLKTF
jgi:hypothetical protein